MNYLTNILANGYDVTIEILTPEVPYIGANYNWWVNGVDTGVKAEGIDGTDGTNGVGITNISKTNTSGLVDTYTIYYTNGATSSFNVTNGANGNGITNISKTSTSGNVDTYTINYTNGSTSSFNVTNGTNGTNGESPQLRMQAGVLQTKLPSQSTWTNLFDFNPYMWQRGTESQRLSIVSPSVGLLYYQTDKALGLYEYKGGAWHFNGERLRKEVSTTTYTCVSEDRGYELAFTNINGCNVTIPNSVFAQGIELFMLQEGAFLNLVAGSGVTINKPTIFSLSGLGVNAMIGLRFKTASVCNAFGNLNLA